MTQKCNRARGNIECTKSPSEEMLSIINVVCC